ncbi:PTS transporter subunit EIIC [Vibrio mexicanus]|uniref:PTS transporter subunit EIIC n=1 Tax=Vibrio mexicanus TaxID=1004326 RepID=UPI000A589ABD|nr:PTS transporter subunit EIIC [Vibrio mexicanus]
MATDHHTLASSVLKHLGGKNNIADLTHCMTRLRITLHDQQAINERELKRVNGVIGVVVKGDKVQVIVGNDVSQVYRAMQNLINNSNSSEDQTSPDPQSLQQSAEQSKPKSSEPLSVLKNVCSASLDLLIATMSPLIPAIIGGSMIKILAMLLQATGILSADDPTLAVLTILGDAVFFFLPIMVAASASIKLKTNMSLAIALAGVMVHPSFISLIDQAANGELVSLIGIPLSSTSYAYSIFPALMMTWVLSHIEKWADRITPSVTKSFLKPMIIMLLATPIALLVIGPLGHGVSESLIGLFTAIYEQLGWFSLAIVGAVWPLIILTGMHRIFTPTIIETIGKNGYELYFSQHKLAPILGWEAPV